MVSRVDIVRRGKRAFDKLRPVVMPTTEEIREKLPLSRGGKPPKKPTASKRRSPKPLETIQLPPVPTLPSGLTGGQIGERIARGAQLRQERMQMTTEDTIRDMVNDPMITVTEDMLPIINDPSILMDINGVLVDNPFAQQFRRDELLQPKKKRKPSKYQKELGRQLKMLKKKHPRTPVTKLMRKAHAATRRALK